jgi:two-component system, sensor histidine kinase YesM
MFKSSIRNKLIIFMLVATIVPFGTSIIITYFHTKESFEDQVLQENRNLLYQGKVNLESYIHELNGLTLSLYKNPGFINFLKNSNKENNFVTIGIITNVIQTILYAEENIERVNIAIDEDDRVVSASKRSTVVFKRNNMAKYQESFIKAIESPYHIYLETIDTLYENSTKPKSIFTLHRTITDIPTDKVLAYLSLEVSSDKIYQLSKNLYNEHTEEFYLLSGEGDFIYSSNPKLLTKQDDLPWVRKLLVERKENGTLEWKDNSFNGVIIYNQLPSSTGGWTLVKRIPYSHLYESAFAVTKINILFGCLGLLLVILATLYVTFKITSPIRVLLKYIQQVEKGNMKVTYHSLGNDEIGVLGYRFKNMIEKIDDLINREYKLEIENKTNQLKVLQSQINPHFLYNALQSIGTIALKNKVPQIYTLVTHLSKIMRYGMNMEESMVPLLKEVNYIRAYLLLQKERFGDQLEYTIDIDDALLQVRVPKMILQPIIENYFKHGFEQRNRVGRIKIECSIKEGFIELNVIDNGIGVTSERLKEIYLHLTDEKHISPQTDENIGIKNVYSRLLLNYGRKAKMDLKNLDKGGFKVSMQLPIQMEDGRNESDYH